MVLGRSMFYYLRDRAGIFVNSDLFTKHSRKINLKTLPKTEVCSFNNKGRVSFKLKLIYLNKSKQK